MTRKDVRLSFVDVEREKDRVDDETGEGNPEGNPLRAIRDPASGIVFDKNVRHFFYLNVYGGGFRKTGHRNFDIELNHVEMS